MVQTCTRMVDITGRLAAGNIVNVQTEKEAGNIAFNLDVRGILVGTEGQAQFVNVDGILYGDGPNQRAVYPLLVGVVHYLKFKIRYPVTTTGTPVFLVGETA